MAKSRHASLLAGYVRCDRAPQAESWALGQTRGPELSPNHRWFAIAGSPVPVSAANFKALGALELQDIELWVLARPDVLGEELLVISNQFDQWDRSKDRLGVLMLDRAGLLVIAELNGSSRRVVGWQAGGMGVIYEVLLGLSVLGSRRDRLPFGEAEQQARATDSSDG